MKPRILFLVDVLAPGGRGGAERAVLLLARELKQRGFAVSTIFPRGGDALTALDALARAGFEARTHPAMLPVDAPRGWRDIIALRNLIASERADVVGLHTGCSWIRFKDVLAVNFALRPCVVTVHSIDPTDSPRQQQGTRLAGKLAKAVVVHSRAVQKNLVSFGVSPRKIRVLNLGVPGPQGPISRQEARQRLGLDADAFVISTLTRLVQRKKVSDVVSAVSRMTTTQRKIVLVIGGDGPERRALEAQAKPLGERVKFLGLVHEPSPLYAASDLFVLPSRHEAFGLVYLEAAHFGVPSIGARDGGVPDVIDDGVSGLLVPPDDPLELAKAMQRLYENDDLRERMGTTARERTLRSFSVASMADAYTRVLGV